jgi:hypothetical protein
MHLRLRRARLNVHFSRHSRRKAMAQDQQPMYRVYTVIKRGRNDAFWLNIGVAFYHRDGQGLNILLQALPLDDRLVLRRYDEQPPKENANGTAPPEPEAQDKA